MRGKPYPQTTRNIEDGEKFGYWTVIKRVANKHNQAKHLCKCACGIEKEVAKTHLLRGNSTKCLKCVGKLKSESRERNKYASSGTRTLWIKRVMERLYKEQDGICPICHKRLPESMSSWCWDHNHKTGEGRGLLHRGCNVFLGFVERDPKIMSRTEKYLEKHKESL